MLLFNYCPALKSSVLNNMTFMLMMNWLPNLPERNLFYCFMLIFILYPLLLFYQWE